MRTLSLALVPCFFLFLLSAVPVSAAQIVEGLVLDGQTGKPLAGAIVTCGPETAVTGQDGKFSVHSIGKTLAVRAAGYLRKEQSTSFPPEFRLTPITPKALYLSFYGAGSSKLRGQALDLIEQTELNSLVIDVKGDRGMISYRSGIPLAKDIGAQEIITLKNLPGLLKDLKAKGIYTIGRIVVFKDDRLATTHPELAIKTSDGALWKDNEGLSWVEPFHRQVWDYNIDIAVEAARLGFDEIQFDYVRFPDRARLSFSRENSEENRVAAISGFLAAARDRLTPYNVYLSADIFGYVCWNQNDTWIGQHLETLAAHVDYLSPMLYPSGFQFGVGKYKNPVEFPYEVIFLTLNKARERTGLPAVRFRPWLQAFRDYAFDRRNFREFEIQAQINASEDFGAHGWMLWNPRNVYSNDGLGQIDAKAEHSPQT